MTQIPKAPDGLHDAGARLWHSVSDLYELDEHEATLLLQASRITDVLDQLTETIEAEGVVNETPQGQRAHPAAVEFRQQAIVLARLEAALRLPAGAEGDIKMGARPPRHQGFHGVHKLTAS